MQDAVQLPTTPPLPGTNAVTDINNAFGTVVTFASGASAPTAGGLGLSGLAGVAWHDTTAGVLKIRNQVDNAWISVGTFDETNNLFIPNVGSSMSRVAYAGTSRTFLATDTGQVIARSNSGTAMTDTLGGSGAPMPAGWWCWVFNTDTVALTISGTGLGFNTAGGGSPSTLVVGNKPVLLRSVGNGNYDVIAGYPPYGLSNVASATTCDIGGAACDSVNITGTTTITSLGTSGTIGQIKYVEFGGALTLTHNGTSLILPNNGSNITTAAGDTAIFQCIGSGNWRCLEYSPANGQAVSTVGTGGTWTPTLTTDATPGTPGYSVQIGDYFKLVTPTGTFIWVSGEVAVTSWTGSPTGNIIMGGLPFAVLNNSAEQGPGNCIVAGAGVTYPSGTTQTSLQLNKGATTAQLAASGSTKGYLNIPVSAYASGSMVIFFNFSYRAA